MKPMNENAVSPVVGVMLMLVVTIIIAAVVSAFAGGIGSDESKGVQASLTCNPKIVGIEDTNTENWQVDYPAGFSANNGLLFEHVGGDAFSLSSIIIQVQTQDTMTRISLFDTIPADTCLSGVTRYIEEIGSSDGLITPGDKFMLYADSCRIDAIGSQIAWRPDGAPGGLALYTNTKCEYKVIDKESNKAIVTGSFVLY
jgi:FlaG/FlaF family flagellin (archaellin)